MRLRDCPTVEVSTRIDAPPAVVWAAVTDITLPARQSPELKGVAWLDGATEPAVGARFEGHNANEHLGEWTTLCTVAEVEPGRRWTWDVGLGDSVWSTWGFEVDPLKDGSVLRQWFRLGPDPSGLNAAIDAMPEREARIIEVRLAEHRDAMAATLATVKADLESGAGSPAGS